jgi:Zn-dependent protease with chaperone function
VSLDWPFIRNAKVEAKDRRFLELFTRTLAKIPPDTLPLGTVRRVNLGRRGRMMGLVGLTIWGDLAYRTDGGGGARNTISGGTQTLSFYAELLNQLSEDASVGVIAHELAHAWLNEHVLPENSGAREADELARRWGFGKELDALDKETESI